MATNAANVPDLEPDRFTDLASNLAADVTPEHRDRYWGAIYELEQWHYLPGVGADGKMLSKSDMPEGQAPPPLVAKSPDGALVVLAFTSAERARHAALSNGVAEAGAFDVLSVPREGAIDLLCRINDERITGVVFDNNEGQQGIFAPLDEIAAMQRYFLGEMTSGAFDRFVRMCAQRNTPQSWSQICREVVAMPTWHMVAPGEEGPPQPQVHEVDGTPALLLFTEQERVSFVGGAGVFEEGAQVRVLSASPTDVMEHAAKLAEASEGQVRSAAFNLGSQPCLISFHELTAALEARLNAGRGG